MADAVISQKVWQKNGTRGNRSAEAQALGGNVISSEDIERVLDRSRYGVTVETTSGQILTLDISTAESLHI